MDRLVVVNACIDAVRHDGDQTVLMEYPASLSSFCDLQPTWCRIANIPNLYSTTKSQQAIRVFVCTTRDITGNLPEISHDRMPPVIQTAKDGAREVVLVSQKHNGDTGSECNGGSGESQRNAHFQQIGMRGYLAGGRPRR
jgi:hypothetical protein